MQVLCSPVSVPRGKNIFHSSCSLPRPPASSLFLRTAVRLVPAASTIQTKLDGRGGGERVTFREGIFCEQGTTDCLIVRGSIFVRRCPAISGRSIRKRSSFHFRVLSVASTNVARGHHFPFVDFSECFPIFFIPNGVSPRRILYGFDPPMMLLRGQRIYPATEVSFFLGLPSVFCLPYVGRCCT